MNPRAAAAHPQLRIADIYPLQHEAREHESFPTAVRGRQSH
jgi:hypothetical protein